MERPAFFDDVVQQVHQRSKDPWPFKEEPLNHHQLKALEEYWIAQYTDHRWTCQCRVQ